MTLIVEGNDIATLGDEPRLQSTLLYVSVEGYI